LYSEVWAISMQSLTSVANCIKVSKLDSGLIKSLACS